MHFGQQKYKISQKRVEVENGNPDRVLERQTLSFSFYKNLKLKVNL